MKAQTGAKGLSHTVSNTYANTSAVGLTLSGEEVGGDAGCDEVRSSAGGKREGGRNNGNESEHCGVEGTW